MISLQFARLRDYLLSPLYEDDEILAIDKPYGLNTHTNDSKMEDSDFIQDGLIEMFSKQLERPLHIVHRLDKTTTGVLVFAKSVESAKKYSEFFFHRKVKKTYFFITKYALSKSEFVIDKSILHKGRELDAETEFEFQESKAGFSLWKALPHTGRNHQIRIHAQEAGISILGDEKYGGAAYPFLCLHNRRIEFPNGVFIEADAPSYFLELEALQHPQSARVLFEADRRRRLYQIDPAKPNDEIFRLVNIKSNRVESGVTIDHLGKYALLTWYGDNWSESNEADFEQFAKHWRRPMLVKFANAKMKHLPLRAVGEADFDSSWSAREENLKFCFDTAVGQFPGLALSQRLQRRWLMENSKRKSVLTLFAQTCSFALAAGFCGATEITIVESSKGSLNFGKQNFILNHIGVDNVQFLCRESMAFLTQAVAKGKLYEIIVCDAPSFLRGSKANFKLEEELENLTELCLRALATPGALLFSTSAEGLSNLDINGAFSKAKMAIENMNIAVECLEAPLDFDIPGERSNLKSFIVTKN